MKRGGVLLGAAVAALFAAGTFVIVAGSGASAQAKKEV